MKVIESNGIKIEDANAYIPPFTLSKGELMHLSLPVGAKYHLVRDILIDIFTQKVNYKGVKVYDSVGVAKLKRVSYFKELFFPITIEKYIEKYIKLDKIDSDYIYQNEYDKVEPQSLLKETFGDVSRMLKIFTAFSEANVVLFWFGGLSPLGREYIFPKVKELVKKYNYSAIILDNLSPTNKIKHKDYVKLDEYDEIMLEQSDITLETQFIDSSISWFLTRKELEELEKREEKMKKEQPWLFPKEEQ
jgi:hypothetical protein